MGREREGKERVERASHTAAAWGFAKPALSAA